jgi:dihydroorotate dehydrogenase (NAD+) catalytic subunit
LLRKNGDPVDLSRRLFGIEFRNPVLAASGTYGYGEEFSEFYDVSLLGGFVTKAVTPESRAGNPPPRIIETPSGMLNAIGLQNDGLDAFIEKVIPRIARMDTVVMVNVTGRTADDYVRVCAALDRFDAVRAFEINISCPNVREGGIMFGTRPDTAARLTEAVRASTAKPIVVKLSPNVSDIADIARAAESAGADGVSLINTLTGMVIDVRTRRPMLANVTGGLSGPAIRPVAVRMVWQTAQAVSVPVIGMGGIFCARDALEFLIAGASLVQVGCGMFVKPRLPLEVIDGIREYLVCHGFRSVGEIIGSLEVTEE